MIEKNMLLLDVNKPDKNGRLFTKEGWDAIITSEANKAHVIPVFDHPFLDEE